MAVVILVMFASGGNAKAQDAIPETPPELRDFRLDPDRAAPQPQPQPEIEQPVIVAPLPVDATAPQRTPATQRPQNGRSDAGDTAAPQPQLTPSATQAPEVTPEAAEPAPVDASPPLTVPDLEPTSEPTTDSTSYTAVGIAAGLLGLLMFAGYWLRRRRRSAEVEERQLASPQTVEPERIAVVPQPKPTPPVAIPKPTEKPKITLDFVPEKATISFNTLTVKGQLRLVNDGDAPATGMELRAGLISASAGHRQAIEAFHFDSNIKASPLGDAKSGERIGMAIELSVPLTEMESYAIGEQKLLVPIMVANLSYRRGDQGSPDVVHFACMIGREANPPAPKMGPLRLDLGPRSFAPLGQRPLYA